MDLAELVRATKGDRSYADLAHATGGVPGAKRWQQIATKPLKNFPDPPTIRAIAKALRVSETKVVMAAAASLGLSTSEGQSRLVELLPPAAGGLTDKQITAVLAIIDALVEPADSGTVTRLRPTPSIDISAGTRAARKAPGLTRKQQLDLEQPDT